MEFEVSTSERTETVDVTERVEAALPSEVAGTCTVFVRHTTAALVVNEAESRLQSDVESFLHDLVADGDWAHDNIDDNADSHLRALVLGPSVTLPVSDGQLDVGRWQSVLLVECDGPRTRTVGVHP